MSLKRIIAGVCLALCGGLACHANSMFDYGVHYPNGVAATSYLYSAAGTWKPMTSVQYPYSYYAPSDFNNSCNLQGRAVDPASLIAYSTGNNQSTSPDKDCHVLMDFLGVGAPYNSGGGNYAFQEHNGYDVTGTQTQSGFNQFWFDDNWLARYVSNAYGYPPPYGLFAPANYNRWAIIGGDNSYWYSNLNPYGTAYFDHITFLGMNALATGNYSNALSYWSSWISQSGAYYDTNNQQYSYPSVGENYYFGFFRILTENMIKSGAYSGTTLNTLIQHSISLRSTILSRQVVNGGALMAWVTDQSNPNSLMNTETASLEILGLGAGGRYAFEAGHLPLQYVSGNYFVRPQNWISAVTGLSSQGHMVYGPYMNFATGPIAVDFFIRSPASFCKMATLDIYDSNAGLILASQVLNASSSTANQWQRVTLSTTVSNPSNSLEFRAYWHGVCNVDVAYVQVR